VEYPAAVKLEMALTMMEKANSGIDEHEWATWAEAKWGVPAYRLKKIMAASGQWQIRMEQEQRMEQQQQRHCAVAIRPPDQRHTSSSSTALGVGYGRP
jgi:hypothetical protein